MCDFFLLRIISLFVFDGGETSKRMLWVFVSLQWGFWEKKQMRDYFTDASYSKMRFFVAFAGRSTLSKYNIFNQYQEITRA